MKFTTKAALLGAGAALMLAVATQGIAAQAPAPLKRLSSGEPDLNGVWDNGGGVAFVNAVKSPDGSICIANCVTPISNPRPAPAAAAAPRPGPDRPKYRPEYLARVKDLNDRQVLEDPVLKCANPGLPRIGAPDRIMQVPGQIAFLYDDISGAFWRVIPTDGRKHNPNAEESFFGDSVGRWEGDTLVIESVKFVDSTWLTDDGSIHSSDMKVTERLRRVGNEMEYQARVDDPKMLAEPWVLRPRHLVLTKDELPEPAPCVEQSIAQMVDPLSKDPEANHDNPR
jgi:hypothetical protein